MWRHLTSLSRAETKTLSELTQILHKSPFWMTQKVSELLLTREGGTVYVNYQLTTGATVELTERSYTVTEGTDLFLFVCAAITTAQDEVCPVDFAFEITLDVGGGIISDLADL